MYKEEADLARVKEIIDEFMRSPRKYLHPLIKDWGIGKSSSKPSTKEGMLYNLLLNNLDNKNIVFIQRMFKYIEGRPEGYSFNMGTGPNSSVNVHNTLRNGLLNTLPAEKLRFIAKQVEKRQFTLNFVERRFVPIYPANAARPPTSPKDPNFIGYLLYVPATRNRWYAVVDNYKLNKALLGDAAYRATFEDLNDPDFRENNLPKFDSATPMLHLRGQQNTIFEHLHMYGINDTNSKSSKVILYFGNLLNHKQYVNESAVKKVNDETIKEVLLQNIVSSDYKNVQDISFLDVDPKVDASTKPKINKDIQLQLTGY